MKKRFYRIAAISYTVAFLLFGAGWVVIGRLSAGENINVKWNEAVHELDLTESEQGRLKGILRYMNIERPANVWKRIYWVTAFVCGAGMTSFFVYFYSSSVRPFIRLEKFAGEIAAGNLDLPLEIERSQMFGTFTWAFDHMREELKEAGRKEEEALEKNKTMIAGISHDIKTPVANIRNYCEGLCLMADAPPERRQKYLEVIMKKCDEVSGLTDDLFLHALNDMDRLSVEPIPVRAEEIWERVLLPLQEQGVILDRSGKAGLLEEETVFADERRLTQVVENVINNAQKYALGSRIEAGIFVEGKNVCIRIKDSGPGIPQEDFLYARQKFYRGVNALDQQGAGLGLYISEVLMKQMKGEIKLRNQNGLEVSLYLERTGKDS